MKEDEIVKMLKTGSRLLALLLLMCSCTGIGSQVVEIAEATSISYDYAHPANRWELNSDLQEISGLDYALAQNTIIAINDEKGHIYQVEERTDSGQKLYEFHKNGDYEGIAQVGKHIYVLKSNGKLFRYNRSKGKTKEIETTLKSKNDAEGLCYDAHTHCLLIACKGLPLDEKRRKKAVYQYSLDKEKLKEEPVVEIDIDDLEDLGEKLQLESQQKWRLKRFSPSGIAIHPVSRHYYILSARGSLLVVVNQQQQIEYLVFLDISALPQPEGICFDADNNLFIASEGKGRKGRLLKFNELK
ncbi:SdiA-regulated domain-containing protein [Carboxylicivirga sp. A043]|uniref:SdiA-regulated domain-containing protein n=1 Tax=Carboxylicivirga litoralis TaxID=2816963 RepID=UPI0021CB2D7E|nr:SdiA-regulated domain-containing protein [Carboxylicivirga sp. A043]MCU4154713.1 SdiA-regulated domain-containing protein [Carboxylicivirga sp. A043]